MEAGLPPLGDGFEHEALGTFGQFATRSGRMRFIQTRARVGLAAGADSAARLMRHLRPFREVIPSTHLDFSQVLQRDIDDYRVAHGLVPYLLEDRPGPAFFPPILAVLLPFNGGVPTDAFPPAAQVEEQHWRGRQAEDAYKWLELLDATGDPSDYSLGKLRWNSDHSRLVVLDGQHRCMALLAIDRTHRGTWSETATGAPYREFYESHVQKLLDKQDDVDTYLNGLEVPVTVAWFDESEANPGVAARQLFVDVNRSAKPPSESRLILLSDSDLRRVFTRSLLDYVKDGQSAIQHYSVEYDNPSTTSRSDRWSAIANLRLLNDATDRCVFDPRDEWMADFSIGAFRGGARSDREEDLRMQREIGLSAIVAEEFDADGQTWKRDDIGRQSFPLSLTSDLVAGYINGWGSVVLAVLAELLPYRAHHEALAEEALNWQGGDEANRLARSAMFDGSGIYWTLEQTAAAAEQDEAIRESMAVLIAAHARVEERGAEFEANRAARFLGKEVGDTTTAEGRRAYQVFRTQACQLGAIVTVASLARAHGVDLNEREAFAEEVVGAWNEALVGAPPGDPAGSRRLAFARSQQDGRPTLNRISDLNATRALLYRYLWIELLGSTDLDALEMVDAGIVRAGIANARGPYYADVVRAQKRELLNAHPEWADAQLTIEGSFRAAEALRVALSYWIGGDTFNQWLDDRVATVAEEAEDGNDPAEELAEGEEP